MVRPLGYLSPSVRNTRHAAAQLLANAASPGVAGMLADLKRLMLASRVTGTGGEAWNMLDWPVCSCFACATVCAALHRDAHVWRGLSKCCCRCCTATPHAAVIGVVVAIDPAVAVPVQAICSYLAAANSGYCSTKVRLLVCTSELC